MGSSPCGSGMLAPGNRELRARFAGAAARQGPQAGFKGRAAQFRSGERAFHFWGKEQFGLRGRKRGRFREAPARIPLSAGRELSNHAEECPAKLDWQTGPGGTAAIGSEKHR